MLCVSRCRYLFGVERISWDAHYNNMGEMGSVVCRCVCLVGYGTPHAQ